MDHPVQYIIIILRSGTFNRHQILYLITLLQMTGKPWKMFYIEENKFIIQAFSKNPSPTKVRREFLRHYNVQKGRKQANYQLMNVISQWEIWKVRIWCKKAQKSPLYTKRTAENLNDLKNMMEEGSLISLQAALNLSFSATTAWRMLRIDAKTKFFIRRSRQ